MKLISMTDFVFEQIAWNEKNKKTEKDHCFSNSVTLDRIEAYAKFLRQPLELWMFVPTDANGNFLEEPICWNMRHKDIGNMMDELCIEYKKAKERVLFEGFEYNTILGIAINESMRVEKYIMGKTIYKVEFLVKNYYVNLTPTAIKMIGL